MAVVSIWFEHYFVGVNPLLTAHISKARLATTFRSSYANKL